MTIEEVNARFDLGIEDPFYNTIGGYVFGQLGRRPELNDEVAVDHRFLRIDQLDGLRIDRLILTAVLESPGQESREAQ